MVMRFERDLTIRDLRRHPTDTVETLRRLLASGARVQADPKRPDFYELEHGSEVFYIYISPVSGEILLLATWANGGAVKAQSCPCAA